VNAAALAMATEYVKRGWSIFPLKPRTKKPATPHGFKDATHDPRIVRNWFDNDAGFNIGIATGVASGLFAVDVDPRHAGDETLGALERRYGPLPETIRALTGGDDQGQHILFRQPKGVKLASSLGDGIEIKSDGGYIVAAPSIHPDSGHAYRWDVGALPSETALADAPMWLVDALTTDSRPPMAPIDGTDAADTVLGRAFELAGWLGDPLLGGKRMVRCPWLLEHSDGRGDGHDSSTVVLPPTTIGRWGAFHCSHAHCAGRRFEDVMAVLKYKRLDGGTPAPAADTRELRSGPSANSAPTPSSESHEAPPDNRRPVTLAQAFEARRKRGPLVRMSTGIDGIDRATCGGIPFGSTVFVVGAPDAAKTLILFSIAVTWARRGVIVGFMAVDEEIDDLVTRLAQQTPKDVSAEGEFTHFTRRDYEAGASEVVDHIEEQIGPLPILFFDAAWTVERATAHLADEGKRLGKLSAFFADSLQTVRSEATPDDASERRVVADNAKALRQAAVRFGIATLATSESNREYSKAKRKGEAGIAMSAGAESRAVEFTARALFVLSSVEDSNLIEVEIPKNKLGPRKTFHLAIDRATQTLSDAPSPEIAPKVDRQAARDERRRLQVTETSERKERERAEAERRKVAEAAEKMVAEDRKLVALLREDRVWLKTEARAALGGGKDPASATIARARAYLVESKGANNSTVITLDATKLPESLR
jgi:hypothetical protein